ncbi:MAG: hypothetical protein M3552_18975, partial [Planctomycetota bacterium]|nr:hypothetical protein [Planctomycetota bacterium]
MQTFRGLIVTLVVLFARPTLAAERFLLAEDSSPGSTWSVDNQVTGNGTFEFQPGANANGAVKHPVEIKATFRYSECRLPSAGRDEAAWRALRLYEEATSGISVGGHASSPQLRSDRRRIVVRADRAGLLPYSPDGPLTSQEVELLPSLGDPLLLAALLPEREVTVGESWNPQPWVGPALAGTEVSFNSGMTCQLQSVASGQALIKVDGTVSGAAKGSTSETTLAGSIAFDVNLKTIVAGELTQTEKRSIGPVTPGMTLRLTSKLKKSAAEPSRLIEAEEIEAIPLEPSDEALRIEHPLDFGAKLVCERDWIAIQQTGTLLVLRLLDHGGIVAQCN